MVNCLFSTNYDNFLSISAVILNLHLNECLFKLETHICTSNFNLIALMALDLLYSGFNGFGQVSDNEEGLSLCNDVLRPRKIHQSEAGTNLHLWLSWARLIIVDGELIYKILTLDKTFILVVYSTNEEFIYHKKFT